MDIVFTWSTSEQMRSTKSETLTGVANTNQRKFKVKKELNPMRCNKYYISSCIVSESGWWLVDFAKYIFNLEPYVS